MTRFSIKIFFFSPEGVQLLCLIDKGLDACRYLQTYGEWHQAAWLAKVSHFCVDETLEVLLNIGYEIQMYMYKI